MERDLLIALVFVFSALVGGRVIAEMTVWLFEKIFCKKDKKSLDKDNEMWYNMYVIKVRGN